MLATTLRASAQRIAGDPISSPACTETNVVYDHSPSAPIVRHIAGTVPYALYDEPDSSTYDAIPCPTMVHANSPNTTFQVEKLVADNPINLVDPTGLLGWQWSHGGGLRVFEDNYTAAMREKYVTDFHSKNRALIEQFAVKWCIPSDLLELVLINETIDASEWNIMADDAGRGVDVGLGQMNPERVMREGNLDMIEYQKFYTPRPGALDNDGPGDISPAMAMYVSNPLSVAYARKFLQSDVGGISSAAKRLRSYLDKMSSHYLNRTKDYSFGYKAMTDNIQLSDYDSVDRNQCADCRKLAKQIPTKALCKAVAVAWQGQNPLSAQYAPYDRNEDAMAEGISYLYDLYSAMGLL